MKLQTPKSKLQRISKSQTPRQRAQNRCGDWLQGNHPLIQPSTNPPSMIVDVHTHFFRPELDLGPALRADMARCGVNPAAWGDVGERHLETTREADVAVVFGLQARATGWNVPNDAVAKHVLRAPERLLFFA